MAGLVPVPVFRCRTLAGPPARRQARVYTLVGSRAGETGWHKDPRSHMLLGPTYAAPLAVGWRTQRVAGYWVADPFTRAPSSMITISENWHPETDVALHHGDCRELLRRMPNASAQLIVTSPPYNLGKKYEKRLVLQEYLRREEEVIDACIDKLAPGGSICWQVGNHVDRGEVFPLDILLYSVFKRRGLSLRNRIIWHFEHGLHCSKRLSGRHETILWFTKGDDYVFNLDAVRVPQKYPGKTYYKGPKRGQHSANPKGKNPGDVWRILSQDWESLVWDIPNVKANH